MIRYKCSKCGAILENPKSMAGQQDKCPLCGHVCTVTESKGRMPLIVGICGGGVALVVLVMAIVWLWPHGNESAGQPGGQLSRVPLTPDPKPKLQPKPKPKVQPNPKLKPKVQPKPKPKPKVQPKPKPATQPATQPKPTPATKPASASATPHLFPVKKDGKWGYIDKTGKIVIEPRFLEAADFSEGMGVVVVNVEGGSVVRYIDHTGKWAIEKTFGIAEPFSEGLAIVENQYIDRTGKVVIPGPRDKSGKNLLKTRFDFAEPFSGGLALVGMGKSSLYRSYGYIDKTGKFVAIIKAMTARSFSGGMAAIQVAIGGGELPKYGYIDIELIKRKKELKVLSYAFAIKPRFVHAGKFSEGLAPVGLGKDYLNPQWGYIDKKGKFVIEPQAKWGKAREFSGGLAPVKVGPWLENGKWGYIDRAGKVVIEAKFDDAKPFSHGLAAVTIDEAIGYIDKTGKYVWKPTK